MRKTISDNIDILDIEFTKNENKYILDSPDKIIRWIKHKFKEQVSKQNEFIPNFEYIDLSNCIINTAAI